METLTTSTGPFPHLFPWSARALSALEMAGTPAALPARLRGHGSCCTPPKKKLLAGWWYTYTPLKNMSSSMGMMTFPIYGKNVPNQQQAWTTWTWMCISGILSG